MNNRAKQLLLFVLIIGILLCIPPIVKAVVNAIGGALGWSADKIQAVTEGAPVLGAVIVVGVVAAVALSAGIAMVAAPVVAIAIVGAVLIVAAVAAIAWCGYTFGKLFGLWGSDDDELPKGQKPDGVSLGGPL